MSDTSKVPPPDIKKTTPEKPPVTTVDAEAPAKKEETSVAEKEESSQPPSLDSAKGVEADFMKRFLGAFIDGVIIAIVITVIGGMLGLVISMVLWLIRDSLPFLDGQSVGKKLMKTKAVKEDGSSLSGDWTTGAIRNITMAIPYGLGGIVELIVLLTRSGSPQAGVRLGDGFAKTKVISVE